MSTDEQGRYWHWDKLRNLVPPKDWSVEEWWAGMKWVRNRQGRSLPFMGTTGSPFMFVMPSCVQAQLNWLDQTLGKKGPHARQGLGGNERSALVEQVRKQEAVYSTLLDGTEPDNRSREGDEPLNDDEWMVQNCCRVLEYVRGNLHRDLTPELLLELQGSLTRNPHMDLSVADRFRNAEDDAKPPKETRDVLWHDPPSATEIEERLFRLCSFATPSFGTGDSLHPIICSILLHLMVLYDRPFAAANGKLARALFYWHMLKSGYEAVELLSISAVLAAAPGHYERSFRYVISDGNDTTYFVIHQLDIIIKAFQAFRAHLEK
jgi:Fic family protein